MIHTNSSVFTKNLVVHLEGRSTGLPYTIKFKPQEKDNASGYLKKDGQKIQLQKITYDSTIKSFDSTKFMKLFMSSTASIAVIVDLDNKIADIKYDQTKSIAPKSTVSIQGLCQEGKYKIELNFDNRDDTSTFLRRTDKSKYEKVGVRLLDGLRSCSNDTFAHVLYSSQNDIDLRVSKIKDKIFFEIFSKSLTENTSEISNSSELIDVVSKEQADNKVSEILETLIRQFSSFDILSLDAIKEVADLPKIATTEQNNRIIEHLLYAFRAQVIKDPEILKALTKIFNNYLKAEYDHTLNKILKSDKTKLPELLYQSPLQTLDSTGLLYFGVLFIAEMEPLRYRQNATFSQIAHYLEAMIVIFNAMLTKGVEVSRKTLDEFYKAIAAFKDRNDLYVSYLARYGLQALRLISIDDSKTHRPLHVFHCFKLAIPVLSNFIKIDCPWKYIESGFQSIPELKRAFTFNQDHEQKWFIKISLIKEIITNSSKEIIKIAKYLGSSDLQGIISADDLNDHNFMMGFINILWDSLQTQRVQEEVAIKAIMLLEEIWFHNNNDIAEAKYKLKKEKYRSQLCQHILEMLYACTKHAKKNVRKTAKHAIADIEKVIGKIEFINNKSVETDFPNRLFTEAVLSIDPLGAVIKAVKSTLEYDVQIMQEREYYIELDGKESNLDQNHQPLNLMVQGFINAPDYNTLVIAGEAGAGKTLFTKLETLEHLQKYNSDGYLYIYVSLPQIEKPFSNLIEKALKTYNIDISINLKLAEEMKNRKIVWIFDAFDEIAFKDELEKKIPICITNQFSEWQNSKFIFTCRNSVYQQLDSQVFESEYGKKKVIYTASFTKDKIYKYLKKVVRVRQQKAAEGDISVDAQWDYMRYKNVAEALSKIPNFSEDVLANPLYLKIISDVLPFIEKRIKDKMPTADITNIFLKSLVEIKTDLYDAYACVTAVRSSIKFRQLQTTNLNLKPEDFLDYSVKVALAMKKAKVQWVAWDTPKFDNLSDSSKVIAASASALPQDQEEKINRELEEKRKKEEEIKKIFTPLFDESDENKRNLVLKKECLVVRNKQWGFWHNDFYTYYRALGEALGGGAWKRVRKLITDNVFSFKNILTETESFQASANTATLASSKVQANIIDVLEKDKQILHEQRDFVTLDTTGQVKEGLGRPEEMIEKADNMAISSLTKDLFTKLNIDETLPLQGTWSVNPVKTNFPQGPLEEIDPTLRNIKAMREELGADEQLKSENMYYIPLQGRNEDYTQNIYFMEYKVDTFLQENNKKMLIMLGNAGSGKSLFTKKYVFTKLTEQYTPDRYLPIHVYLPSFKQSFFSKKLLEDILARYGFTIETDPVLRNTFHQRKILWVLDAYNEIDFDGNQKIALSDVINFEEWTNSKFLVTCRTQGFAQIGLDKFRIREGARPEVIYTVEFNSTKMKDYFKNFAEVYKKNNAQFSWTYQDYAKVIKILEEIHFMYHTFLKNPLMIKLLAYTIPLMITIDKNDHNGRKLSADIKKKFSGDPNIVDNHIKHTMAAFIAERSYRSCRNIENRHTKAPEAKDFLKYTAEFALNLINYKMTGCKWPISKDVKIADEAKEFFSQKLDDKIEPNFIYKNKCLSYRNGEWTLEHDELIHYYSTLIGGIDGDDYELVEELRQSDEFQNTYNAVHGY